MVSVFKPKFTSSSNHRWALLSTQCSARETQRGFPKHDRYQLISTANGERGPFDGFPIQRLLAPISPIYINHYIESQHHGLNIMAANYL